MASFLKSIFAFFKVTGRIFLICYNFSQLVALVDHGLAQPRRCSASSALYWSDKCIVFVWVHVPTFDGVLPSAALS